MGMLAELKRRNVYRVAVAYLVVSWLAVQVGDTLAPALRLPDWVNSALLFFLIVGFPIALVLSWAFEITPEGVRRESGSVSKNTPSYRTRRNLDIFIGLALGMALIYLAFDKFVLDPERDANLVETTKLGLARVSQAATSEKSIAVLPFDDLSPTGDQGYFGLGIAEEVLNVLARVDGLRVTSRTSAFEVKKQGLTIPMIAARLNVRYILEGSVRTAGEQVRVTAQLLDAETDSQLWSETYDRQLTTNNLFEIQNGMAMAISDQLGVVVDGWPEAVTASGSTQNFSAYDLYLEGHQLFTSRSDIARAIALLEQAVAADPHFARAWAALAATYSVAPSWDLKDRDYLRQAIAAAQEAITIDASLALPYAVLASVAMEERPVQFDKAFAYFDNALRRDPRETSALLWRGILRNAVGHFELAEEDFQHCLEVDRQEPTCRRHLALSKLFAGDAESAFELFEMGQVVGVDSVADAFLTGYAAHENHVAVLMYLSGYYTAIGQAPLIEHEYRALTDPTYDFDTERAEIEATHKAVTGEALDWSSSWKPFIYKNYAELKPDPTWSFWWAPYPVDFKLSPHRKRLMQEIGLHEYWRAHGFPPQCRAVGDDDFECS